MNAMDVARSLGIPDDEARGYLLTCNDVVESEQYVAVLRKNVAHLAADVKGLGGRKLLRGCRETLRKWFVDNPILFACIKPGNDRAVRLVEALGFTRYDATDTHIWLAQTKEQFDAKSN